MQTILFLKPYKELKYEGTHYVWNVEVTHTRSVRI